MARKLEVEIVGDASSLHSALGRAGSQAESLGGRLAHLGKMAALAAGAAGVGALVVGLRIGVKEFMQSQRVAAQTAAVLKSTGGAANVTGKHVRDLATRLMKLSGVDDEVVATGENMLLTFKNIKNQVGKNNDIFDQATKATFDMDVAMSHGNVTQENLAKTSILVGKALNDPIKGLTALHRVGVDFTKQQEAQIKAMVAAGDTMGAQKIILKELTSEFGGSAKALGSTLGGQINIIRERFNNWAGDVVSKMIPALTKFAGFAADAADSLFKFFGKVIHAPNLKLAITFAAQGIKGLAVKIGSQIKAALAGVNWGALGNQIQAAITAVNWSQLGTRISAGIAAGLNFTEEQLGKVLKRVLEWVNAHAKDFADVGLVIALNMVSSAFDPAFYLKHWQLILSVAVLFFAKGFGKIGAEAADAFFTRFLSGRVAGIAAGVMLKFNALPELVQKVAIKSGQLFYQGVVLAIFPLEKVIGKVPEWIKLAFKISGIIAFYGALQKVAGAVQHIGSMTLGGLLGAFSAVVGWVKTLIHWIEQIPKDITIHVHVPGSGLISGIGSAIGGVAHGKFPRASGGMVRAGQSYIVGERGPEILTGSAGRIIPNKSMGGSAPIYLITPDGKALAEFVFDGMRGVAQVYRQRTGRPAFGS